MAAIILSTYATRTFDAFDHQNTNEWPGQQQTKNNLPANGTHVVESLTYVQHVATED